MTKIKNKHIDMMILKFFFILLFFSSCCSVSLDEKNQFTITKIQSSTEQFDFNGRNRYNFQILGAFSKVPEIATIEINLKSPESKKAICITEAQINFGFNCFIENTEFNSCEKIIFDSNTPQVEKVEFTNWKEYFEKNSDILDVICINTKEKGKGIHLGEKHNDNYNSNENESIEIEINYSKFDDKAIDKNGILFFETYYFDNENIFDSSDLEQKTLNRTYIEYQSQNYSVNCHLLKLLNKNLSLICILENDLAMGNYYNVKMFEYSFNYNGYEIKILSKELFYIMRCETSIPLFYSDEQTIVIEEGKENYELKFGIIKYNNEPMILNQYNYNIIQLNNCTKKNNELICILKKNEIEENLILNENILYLELYYFYFLKSITLGPISEINIIDNTIKKENVYVLITKLAENNLNKEDNIILETNVTSVSNLITDFFFFFTYNY